MLVMSAALVPSSFFITKREYRKKGEIFKAEKKNEIRIYSNGMI